MKHFLWRIFDWLRRFIGFYLDLHNESYHFSVCSKPFPLGQSYEFSAEGIPQLGIHVERILMNAPCPGFMILSSVVIDGLQLLMGHTDVFYFAPTGGLRNFPPIVLKKGASVRVEGTYTGMVPSRFEQVSDAYRFTFAASMVGRPLEQKPPEWVWRRPYWTYWYYWSPPADKFDETEES